jgi:Xaa-Pro aminopeptidase
LNTRTSTADWPEIYRQRRNEIRAKAGDGVILWMGHVLQPRNYADNTYPFRQNSNFLYYTGISEPGLAMLSFPDSDHDILFSKPASIDDVVWTGPGASREELARDAGIAEEEDIDRLQELLAKEVANGKRVQYLPPFQTSLLLEFSRLLGMGPNEVVAGASTPLMEAVAGQRSVKTDVEIGEIEEALCITDRMHRLAMAAARPGIREYELGSAIQAIALSYNRQQAYNPIITVHGEVLHQNSQEGILEDGRLLLNDSGAESLRYYASDITRTFPVSGRFTTVQAEVYQIALRMQLGAIEMIKPGISYRDVHLGACRIMVDGLRSMGLMKGDGSNAIEAGAHALFFPHGIGHMLGLDVHDMEDLGDIVGYKKKEARSSQFGLNYLRLSRPLKAGFVFTVEPGIYFIPALIDRWQQEGLHKDFLIYDRINEFCDFGGIRIEDDVIVSPTGTRILGPEIPKTVAEVEEACGRGRDEIDP